MPYTYSIPSLVKIGQGMVSVECPQGCYGRTDGRTVPLLYPILANFVTEGIIKRHLIMQKYENGGLKMIDIYKFLNALKASWIKRIFDENNKGMWKLFYSEKLSKYGGKLIFECNIDQSDIKNIFPKTGFLQDIILAWNEINTNKKPVHIGKEILWNNSFLKIGERTIFNKTLFDRGIQYIEQIYDYRKKDFYDFRDFSNIYGLPHKHFLFYTSIVLYTKGMEISFKKLKNKCSSK